MTEEAMTKEDIGDLYSRKKKLEREIVAYEKEIQELAKAIGTVSEGLQRERNCSMQGDKLVFYRKGDPMPACDTTFPSPKKIADTLTGLNEAQKELEKVKSELDKV